MARPFRQQIDEGILDRAAALFAQHGFEQTSLQAVADAVGLSKAGLLHHFPSKDVLHDAVLTFAETLGRRVLEQAQELPQGPERDRRAVETLVDVALAHPGVVALLLAPAMKSGVDAGPPEKSGPGLAALEAFAVDPETAAPERLVRVIGALSALAVLSIAAQHEKQTTAWRPLIVATCLDTLGHCRPGHLSEAHQAEA